MRFSYNLLKDYVKKMPKPEKVAELLTVKAFEVAEVKKSGGDFVLDIDVLPNRAADCFSHFGVAREISAITGLVFREPFSENFRERFSENRTKDFISIEIKNKEACPRYTAKVVTDVKVGPSPKWLKERLKTCGLNSINNIVDVVNYVMLETGQPLHAFDVDKLDGRKIIVRFAKNREKIVTLDEQKFDLSPDILVIADRQKPVAIAGIKGGKLPEIDKKTKIIVLESANFDPRVIRRGSKKLNLKTDASLRFEHGLSPGVTEMAVKRAAYLVQKISGGKIALGLVDVYPKKVYPRKIKLDQKYAQSLLGMKITTKEIKNILGKLGFKIIDLRNPLLVEAPIWRIDVSIPEDLIEEIGRIHGYEKIPSIFPVGSLAPSKRNEEIFWQDTVKNILKEAGFNEIYNYSFIGQKEAGVFSDAGELIEVENPISQDFKYLRPSLIPNLLKNVRKNIERFNEIRIFELGKIFKKTRETRQLTGLMTGTNFYYLKGVMELLFNKLGIAGVWYDDYKPTPEKSKLSLWHAKKCAEVKIDSKEIGFLGEISPKILQSLEISERIVVFDLDFEELQKLASEEHQYMPLSRFPAAIRDLAVLVPKETKVVEVLNKINVAGGRLVRDVDLFDVYEGEELPQGKKNLAFHITYQSESRTLNSKEVQELHQKIIKSLEKNLTWQVRK